MCSMLVGRSMIADHQSRFHEVNFTSKLLPPSRACGAVKTTGLRFIFPKFLFLEENGSKRRNRINKIPNLVLLLVVIRTKRFEKVLPYGFVQCAVYVQRAECCLRHFLKVCSHGGLSYGCVHQEVLREHTFLS